MSAEVASTETEKLKPQFLIVDTTDVLPPVGR